MTLSIKARNRLLFRSLAFFGLIAGAFILSLLSSTSNSAIGGSLRRLADSEPESSEEGDDKEPVVEENKALADGDEWLLIFYIAGVFYMFVALAVVCDEFFVPALEVISDNLALDPDVAGATFMAAGGSAPELFTSFIGTFQESNVGFGTIVGSAVFNVLFVIAMCAIFSTEVLELTWWPLARDCTYYTLSLMALGTFFGIISPDEIEWWEATILLLMYFGYVLVMKYHQALYLWIQRKRNGMEYTIEMEEEEKRNHFFKQPSSFRTGVLQLMLSDKSILETAGIAAVTKIKGDVHEVFSRLDTSCDGQLDASELHALLHEMNGKAPSPEQLQDCMTALDTNRNGTISFEEFAAWYCKSEDRIHNETRKLFMELDTDHSGTVSKDEVRQLLIRLGVSAEAKAVKEAMKDMDKSNNGQVTLDEFTEWYEASYFWRQKKEEISAETEAAEGLSLAFPTGTKAQVTYIVMAPLTFLLYFTLPNVHKPQYKKFAVPVFFGSIAWIGVFSFFMVEWTTVIGDTLGIPIEVMGLTFLAAGTSVPDLLSSVIVAKQGLGDMAVSSSIGSNIFDVLVGLPLPWLAYSAIKGKAVEVVADTLFVSIIILLGMLVTVIVTIKANNWRLTNKLGYTMFILYFLFVIQDLLRSDLFCDGGCL